ncbi:hypothetical protein Tco_0605277 [Tanacetum coccineum]
MNDSSSTYLNLKSYMPVQQGAVHPVFEELDTKYPDFAKEPRNVRLGLAADGFNPFGNLSQAYSMWPVILTTYNLPPWLCMKESSFMLTLLIPGPKSPGKDIDVYLRPLIEDLKVLWDRKGVETIDVASGQKFNMRAMVLWTINDFPARSSLSGWSGQGYKACPTCNKDTPSVRVLSKTAYVGHRRFLKKPHKWRSSREFNGQTDNRDPPKEFGRDEILAQLDRLPTRLTGKHPSYGGVKIKRNVLVELNWTKRSIFYELEYWSFLSLRHNLDIMHIEKNVLEAILNTLLMNDKSKDTAKARQDLQMLGIRSGLWLGQTKNGKCLKPQAAYSFTPENRKKFCQYIKGVKLPDGFGSCFKHKVTDNDTNITGLKSHDCHIMMQRLLPYGLQNYLPDKIAKPIIDLCSLFKQICSATLMEDDMLKAQIKVVDILCELELIYPPALFDIMVHLVIHLPIEALEGGPIRPRWMYPFERYMKKLKGYVRNKAKPEGSIAEGYVAEEALTFSSHYFRDVTTKFNRPDRNVDPPPATCRFQVFRSVCKPIGLRSFIRFDAQELKKVKWYVLHNSPEIDTYRSQFKSLFPNKDMQEEFPDWFGSQIRQRHVDNDQDPEVSTTSELFALANGPSWTPISVNSCVVDGVRYVVHSRDERRTTQNSGICSPGPDGEMYYGQLQEIIEFKYLLFKVALFRVKWFDTSNKGRKVNKLVLRNNMTQINCNREAFKDDQYILVTQVKQVFYLEDKTKPHWKVVEHVNHKKFSDGGVIVVEDDPDIIHFDKLSDLPLSTSLNDLNNATLHIDSQSTMVDAPPDIIDVLDEDDDIIGDEDALPHDLADSDVEDLINVDDDADVARSHGVDGGDDDHPPSHVVLTSKGKPKPNLGGRGAGRLNTRDKTQNLSLKEIAEAKGPVSISFEQGDKETLNPLGPHAAHWSNYIGEVVRSVLLYYPSWEKVQKERKAAIISKIGIYKGINMHLQKAYNTNKASFKAKHWKADPTTGTYDVEAMSIAQAAQNRLNRQKSFVISRQGSRSLARLRDEMASDTKEYPSLIDTFWRTHTIDEVFPNELSRNNVATQLIYLLSCIFVTTYEEIKRIEATGEYTENEINALARGGKLHGHIPGVRRVLPSLATSRPSMSAPDKLLKSMHRKVDFMMSLFRSNSKYSDMFKEFKWGGASGSGGCGNVEESGDDEDDDGGRNYWRDRKVRWLWVSQEKYIEKVLQVFFVAQSKPVSTPLADHFKLDRSTISGKDKEFKYMKTVSYSSAFGSLMYAMVCMRPDLAHAVSVVSRFMANPRKAHWKAVKWILRYLKGVSNIFLVYDGKGHGNGLIGYADSDYGGDLVKRRSLTCFIFTLFGCAISWKSTLQSTIALSTTKAEYMSMTEGIKKCIWLHGLVQSLGLNVVKPVLFCDS